MSTGKVVEIEKVRNLLLRLDEARREVLRGSVDGFSLALSRPEGEKIILGGLYEQDPEAALRVAMAMSWERTKEADFAASSF